MHFETHFFSNSNILSWSFSRHSAFPRSIIICKLLISTLCFYATINLFDFIVINWSLWNPRRRSRVHFLANMLMYATMLNNEIYLILEQICLLEIHNDVIV